MWGEKMEMNLVPVIAAARDLVQIMHAITAAAARRPPLTAFWIEDRINSSKLAHLAHPEISLRAESSKQVLLHLFFYHRQATD